MNTLTTLRHRILYILDFLITAVSKWPNPPLDHEDQSAKNLKALQDFRNSLEEAQQEIFNTEKELKVLLTNHFQYTNQHPKDFKYFKELNQTYQEITQKLEQIRAIYQIFEKYDNIDYIRFPRINNSLIALKDRADWLVGIPDLLINGDLFDWPNYSPEEIQQLLNTFSAFDFYQNAVSTVRKFPDLKEALLEREPQRAIDALNRAPNDNTLNNILNRQHLYRLLPTFTHSQKVDFFNAFAKINFEDRYEIKDALDLIHYFQHDTWALERLVNILTSETNYFEYLKEFAQTEEEFLRSFYIPQFDPYFFDLFPPEFVATPNFLTLLNPGAQKYILFSETIHDTHVLQQLIPLFAKTEQEYPGLKKTIEKVIASIKQNQHYRSADSSPELLSQVLNEDLPLHLREDILLNQTELEDSIPILNELNSTHPTEKSLIDAYLEKVADKPYILKELTQSTNPYIKEQLKVLLKVSNVLRRLAQKLV